MTQWYVVLHPVLCTLSRDEQEKHDVVLLTKRNMRLLHVLSNHLGHLHGATKEATCSSHAVGVRRICDTVLKQYPEMKSRLLNTAAIVNNSQLESGLVKMQREEVLTSQERTACADFKSVRPVPVDVATATIVAPFRSVLKKRNARLCPNQGT